MPSKRNSAFARNLKQAFIDANLQENDTTLKVVEPDNEHLLHDLVDSDSDYDDRPLHTRKAITAYIKDLFISMESPEAVIRLLEPTAVQQLEIERLAVEAITNGEYRDMFEFETLIEWLKKFGASQQVLQTFAFNELRHHEKELGIKY